VTVIWVLILLNDPRRSSNAISYGLAWRAAGCSKEDYTRHDGCFYTHYSWLRVHWPQEVLSRRQSKGLS